MGVRDTFPGNTEVRAVVASIVTSHCIEFLLGQDGCVHFTLDSSRAPRELRPLVNHLIHAGPSATLEMLVQGYAFHEGLKVVTLNQLDAEALENTLLNFPMSDYTQPFPTLFIDLPESFFQNHEVSCPQGGEFYAGMQTPDQHYPHTVGLRHYKDDTLNYIIASVYFTSHQAFSVLLDGSGDIETLEDSITASFSKDRQLDKSKYVSPEEEAVTLAALRVALNAVLILEGEGMRKLGPTNPQHYHKLEEHVRKAHKRRDPAEKIARAEQLLRAEPIYYAFDQRVVVYHREDVPADGVHEPTGRHLRPHWRSGYHRLQHFGIGNSQCKRIRVPPVMVNKYKFLGQPRDTTATYEVRL